LAIDRRHQRRRALNAIVGLQGIGEIRVFPVGIEHGAEVEKFTVARLLARIDSRARASRKKQIDDRETRRLVASLLSEEGYAVDAVGRRTNAAAAARAVVYDAVVLDLGLPDGDGIELCREWRRAGMTTPILVVTARADVASRVRGLDAGADDYVGKPFRMAELLARVRALLRRRVPALMEIGGVRVETGSRRVEVDGAEVTLSNKEFELLRVMMSRAGQVVTREEILSEVWNDPTMKTSKTLDMHMSWLRRKIARPDADGGEHRGDQRISTVRGVGFRFETD